MVMIMAISILRGFRGDITDKVVGFGSHITVHPYGDQDGIMVDQTGVEGGDIRGRIERVPGVRKVQAYATKGGMVKTQEQIHGIMFRGLEAGYDTSFFADCLVEGSLPVFAPIGDTLSQPSNDVLISSTIASKLGFDVGDKVRTYFWHGDNYRARAFTVCGIYSSDLTEMDELYVIGDIRQVMRLNGWEDSARVGGWEILVDDFDQLDNVCLDVMAELPYTLTATTVREANPPLFSWLDLLSSNITLILAIMCIVCSVAIVSALLIMIFEKSSTIGVLKTLGATNRSIRMIFILRAARLILAGIAAGDLVALSLCYIQNRWQLLKLDAESYAMNCVPVDMDWRIFMFVSIGTLAVCLLALLLPAAYISKINPAQTVKTE